MGKLEFYLFSRKTDVLSTPNNHWFFIECNFSKSIELLASMYVLRCHAILRYIIYLYIIIRIAEDLQGRIFVHNKRPYGPHT